MPNISVIIPVYNVERYIKKCVISLFEQTLDNIEFIFINDCSIDNSVDIIINLQQEYSIHLEKKKSVARIINMPHNSGLAAVRSKGIVEASGDYVIHCDGDDWVDKDLYEKMYNVAINTGSGIVVSSYIYEKLNKRTIHNVEISEAYGKDIIQNLYKEPVGMYCWNKLVKKSLYIDNGILPWAGFDMWEDNGLMIRLFYYCKRVSVVRDSYYHYNRTNIGAMTADYGDKQVEQMIGIAEKLSVFFDNLEDSKKFQKTKYYIQYLAKINLIKDDFSNISRYNSIFPKSYKIIKDIDLNSFSKKGLIRFYFVKYNMAWLFILLFKLRTRLCNGK